MNVIKLNKDPSTFTKAETTLIDEAVLVGAPIAVALRQNPQNWHVSPMGQTHRPRKQFVDLRTMRKISLGSAKQIVAKYARKLDQQGVKEFGCTS
tara:strand:- start:1675 stop:1959 length:285 start_codon:yes stop_codon:yes gene_type:complete